MSQDIHGLPLSTSSREAANAFNDTVVGYLKYRFDTPEQIKRTLAADPQFALAHCLKGYFAMLAYKEGHVVVARDAARTARGLGATATSRERAHVAALGAWVEGDIERTIAIWEEILAAHPADVLALRLAHFTNFW